MSTVTKGLIDSVKNILKQRIHLARAAEATEKNVQLADAVWQTRRIECNLTSATAIDLVLGKAHV